MNDYVKKTSRVHQWLYRKYGKASRCCNDEKHGSTQFEWANVSGEYKMDINDWFQLCPSCHRKYDYKEEYREMIRKRNKWNGYHNKKLRQFDKNWNFIKEWKSGVEVEKTLGILRSCISNVLAGRSQTAGDWRWSH